MRHNLAVIALWSFIESTCVVCSDNNVDILVSSSHSQDNTGLIYNCHKILYVEKLLEFHTKYQPHKWKLIKFYQKNLALFLFYHKSYLYSTKTYIFSLPF